jgi:hypothetical protein
MVSANVLSVLNSWRSASASLIGLTYEKWQNSIVLHLVKADKLANPLLN